MSTIYDRLFAHLIWADDQALEALRSAPDADRAALKLLAHILGSDEAWLARIEERPKRVPVWPEITLGECATLAAEVHARLRTFLESLEDAALTRVIRYRNTAGDEFESSLDDILTHMALHGAYHRGQIAMLLRQSGGTPAVTDYIAFTRRAPT